LNKLPDDTKDKLEVAKRLASLSSTQKWIDEKDIPTVALEELAKYDNIRVFDKCCEVIINCCIQETFVIESMRGESEYDVLMDTKHGDGNHILPNDIIEVGRAVHDMGPYCIYGNNELVAGKNAIIDKFIISRDNSKKILDNLRSG
jgi:hypothetical protein